MSTDSATILQNFNFLDSCQPCDVACSLICKNQNLDQLDNQDCHRNKLNGILQMS